MYKKTGKFMLAFAAVSLMLLSYTPIAEAWEYLGYKYGSTSIQYRIMNGTPSSVTDAWDSAAEDWYDAHSDIHFTKNSSAVNECGHVHFSDIAERGWMDPYKSATTIHSFDAVINTAKSAGTNNRHYRSTANHEFGHVLGLDHVSISNSIMNGNRDLNSVYTPKSDDITGVILLYNL